MEPDRLCAVEPGESHPDPDDLEDVLRPLDRVDPASGLRTELHEGPSEDTEPDR